MALAYLDQNAILKLGFKARDDAQFREKMDAERSAGAFQPVVSSLHLIETANTKNVAAAKELAVFIDSLEPGWLLERRDLQARDVAIDFFKFSKIPFMPPAAVTAKRDAFALLMHQTPSPKFEIPAPTFVEQWIQKPEQLEILTRSVTSNIEALTRLRELQKAGKITETIRQTADRKLLEQLLPAKTPSGLELGRQIKKEYLDQARIEDIPTLAIESAISNHEWGTQTKNDRNTLFDKFHLISALPTVDEIVSDDKFFSYAREVAEATGHVKARVTNVEQLIARLEKK